MNRRQPMTAADLLAELEADPDFVARRRARREHAKKQEEELKSAEAPLVEDLRAAGFTDVESSWDLVNTSTPYPEAVPILLMHLQRPYPDRTREGIARALAVPEARSAWANLLRSYEREDASSRAKDGLAVALAALANDDVLEDVIELVRDTGHGESRVFFVRTLARSGNPRARAVLRELQGDPHLEEEIRRMTA